MATKDSVIRVRVESTLKSDVEKILTSLGLNYSEVITLLLSQIKLNKGLPFEVKIPNAETIQALEDSRQGKNLTTYSSVAEAKEASRNW